MYRTHFINIWFSFISYYSIFLFQKLTNSETLTAENSLRSNCLGAMIAMPMIRDVTLNLGHYGHVAWLILCAENEERW